MLAASLPHQTIASGTNDCSDNSATRVILKQMHTTYDATGRTDVITAVMLTKAAAIAALLLTAF
jgi:hypothetical protein